VSKNNKKQAEGNSHKPHKRRGKQNTAKKKARLLLCLEKFCTISEACEKVGIGRKTYYDWIDNDPKFAEDIEALDKWNLANAEGKLNKLVNGYKYEEVHLENTIILGGKGKNKKEVAVTPTITKKTIIKEVQPNERAIEFLATNRNRKRWKNRTELTGDDGEPIAVNIIKFSDVKGAPAPKHK
jgi:hypothetical protein